MPRPLVFVIGDSISIQYGPYLQQRLDGDYRYDRKQGLSEAMANLDIPAGANGGDSGMVLRYLWALRDQGDWRPDLLVLNCGLHDIKCNPNTGTRQVSIEDYQHNLRAIVAILRDLGVRLAWVRTTGVVDEIHNSRCREFWRHRTDLAAYNAAADAIMGESGAAVLDLYGFTLSFGEQAFCDHVHYHDDIRRRQADYLAGEIRRILPPSPK